MNQSKLAKDMKRARDEDDVIAVNEAESASVVETTELVTGTTTIAAEIRETSDIIFDSSVCNIRSFESLYFSPDVMNGEVSGNSSSIDQEKYLTSSNNNASSQMFPMLVFNPSFGAMMISKLIEVNDGNSKIKFKYKGASKIPNFNSHAAAHVMSKGCPHFSIEIREKDAFSKIHSQLMETGMFGLLDMEIDTPAHYFLKNIEDFDYVLIPVVRTFGSIFSYSQNQNEKNDQTLIGIDEDASGDNDIDKNDNQPVVLESNKNSLSKKGFLIYAIPGSKGKHMVWENSLFAAAQLPVVFGLDHTLLRFYDLKRNPPPREGELAMLTEFDMTGMITLPGGRVITSSLETTLTDSISYAEDLKELQARASDASNTENATTPFGNTGWSVAMGDNVHPVIYLHSPEGSVVFTKILLRPGRAHSFIVHIRSGWVETRSYILHGNNQSPDVRNLPLFRVHVLSKDLLLRRIVLELWRLLDPTFELIKREDLTTQLVSTFKAKNEPPISAIEASKMLSLDSVLMKNYSRDMNFAFGVDCSSRWTGSTGISRIWPITPYDPYFSPVDSGLSITIHFLHEMRNIFYARCHELERNLQIWLDYPLPKKYQTSVSNNDNKNGENAPFILPYPPPEVPDVGSIVGILKHRWLKEFQAVQSTTVPKPLVSARDYADPALRNKWHAVIDTNALHVTDKFELFLSLQHHQSERLVLVIPFATVHELDWQKHNSKKEDKTSRAQEAIRFINQYVSSGSRFIVLQSADEDAYCTAQGTANSNPGLYANLNGKNDMRVYECAKVRHQAGLVLLIHFYSCFVRCFFLFTLNLLCLIID